MPVVQDGAKAYAFTVRWGDETDTDDAEGQVVATLRRAAVAGRNRRGAAALRRRHLADAADLFGDQDRRRARLRSRPRRRRHSRSRRARSSFIASTLVAAERDEARVRGRMRQGRLCARDGARSRPRARLLRPCRPAPPHARRAVLRRARRLASKRWRLRRRRARRRCCRSKRACRNWRASPIDRNGAAILRRGQKLLLRGAAAAAVGAGLREFVSARRSRSARSKTAISSRRASSICRTDDALSLPGRQRVVDDLLAVGPLLERQLGDAVVAEQHREIEPAAVGDRDRRCAPARRRRG